MKQNSTVFTYFIIKGLSDIPELQAPIFVMVLLIYIISLVSNFTLFLLVCLDSHLHTPMYFFLANLSIVDMMSTTVTLHKIFVTFITGDNTMLFLACVAQYHLFASLSSLSIFLLTAMSYDRYVAICRPLNYKMIMNFKICLLLASVCWIVAFAQMFTYISVLVKISCFSSNVFEHFYCDLVPFMHNACSDVSMLVSLSYSQGVSVYGIPFLLTSTSYIFIIRSIMKMSSSTGRRKAIYTCSSHLTVFTLIYATMVFQYLIPNIDISSSRICSFFHSAIVPMLNPLIYSLKNKDVKTAFRKMIGKWTRNAL